MAGPEGFDASLIETEALLKRMKPRPANLSAARIVYEAGRAVGKEETQALLASGGLVLAAPPAAASVWKKWILPSWAGGATVLCLVLWFQFGGRNPKTPEPYSNYPNYSHTVSPHVTNPYQSPAYSNPVENQVADQNTNLPERVPVDKLIVPVSDSQKAHTQAVSDSQNQSGVPREGRDQGQPKPREKNLAEYLREQLPSLESRRNFDPMEIPASGMQPSGGGMALTALGFIKSP